MMQSYVVEQEQPPIVANQGQRLEMANKHQPLAQPNWLPSTWVYHSVTHDNPETKTFGRIDKV